MCFKLLCNKKESPTDSTPVIKEDVTATESVASFSNTTGGQHIFLKTLLINVYGKSECHQVKAVIDDGSHKSYILESLARKLKLTPVGKENVVHQLFGGHETKVQQHMKYNVRLSDLEDNYSCELTLSDSVKISGVIDCYQLGPWTKELNRHGVTLSDIETGNTPVDILLGADVAGKLLTGKFIKLQCGPVALQTKLGWTLLGETNKISNSISSNQKIFKEERVTFLSSSMLDSCVTENLTAMHVSERAVEKLWSLDSLGITDPSERVSKVEHDSQVMENFFRTVKINDDDRVEVELPWITGHAPLPSYKWIAERKLQITTNKLIQDGNLEAYDKVFKLWQDLGIIEEVPVQELEDGGHYLQHRAVYNTNSSTTPIRPVFNASYKKKGQPSLNDCLEKGPNMLEQIPAIVTRFRLDVVGLLADIEKAFQQISVKKQDRNSCRFLWWRDIVREIVVVLRHCRVAFGVNASPFLLAATLKFVIQQAHGEKKQFAEKLEKSFYVDNLVVAVGSYEEANVFQQEADELLSTVKFKLRGWEIGPVNEEKTASLLGLKWNMKKDTIFCGDTDGQTFEEPITRRKILSVTNSVFDPLGFTLPFMLQFKLLVQETWSKDDKKIGWDTAVSDSSQEKFRKLCKQLGDLKSVEIPRWITRVSTDRKDWSLHIFVDGSKKAYAAAAYLRVENGEHCSTQLIQARSRITPLKELTIPRTELLACLIGVRLGVYVKESLEYQEIPTTYWTDSSTAFHWITNNGEWGIFVRNRVNEIIKLSRRMEWRHVSGEHNPADLPSRGCSVKQLLESSWWEGPAWLRWNPNHWPKSVVTVNEKEVDAERKKTVVSALNHSEEQNLYEEVCQQGDFTAMVNYLKEKLYCDKPFSEVEDHLLALVQRIHFKGAENQIRKLDTFQSKNGITRIKTRLFFGSFDENFRCPVVLPSESPVVRALVMKVHNENSHGGTQFLITKLREDYWILRCRKTVREVIRKCISCRRFDATGVKVNTPPLTKERMEAQNPFEVTGVDLCGPMFLRDKRKVWVALFTCAVYRAVHLELVTSLSTEQFKLALRRFVSRRGKPRIIFSDNGTNFVGCSNEMKKVDWSKIEKSNAWSSIEWRHIPPRAPWWGGYIFTNGIDNHTRRRRGNHQSASSKYVSEDPEDLIALTPYMFLVGNKTSGIPELDQVDGKSLNKRRVREDLRTRFRQEYLGQLNNLKHEKESPGIKIGDIVLVQCDNKKRLEWPIGKVLELTPGRDGKVRVVLVKTSEGELKRPIQRISPLEVPMEGEYVNEKIKLPKTLSVLDNCSVTG